MVASNATHPAAQSTGGYAEHASQLDFAVGPVFCGLDVHAFILPTFAAATNVFRDMTQTLSSLTDEQLAALGNTDYQERVGKTMMPDLVGVSSGSHRDKFPVRSLGRMNPHWFVGSARTVAGSLIFHMGDRSPLSGLLTPAANAKMLYADELPYFDLYLTFLNDAGAWSSRVIQGISILDENEVMDSDGGAPMTVNYSYMALGRTPIMPGYFSVLPAQMRDAPQQRDARYRILGPERHTEGTGTYKRMGDPGPWKPTYGRGTYRTATRWMTPEPIYRKR